MLKEPESMEELVYFTKRAIGSGRVVAWVYRGECPRCKKALMGKPKDKSGKVMIRAKEYVCPECGYRVPKQEYEGSLTANIKYSCPHCGHKGETQIPFKRKKVKIFDEEEGKEKMVDALQFACDNCKKKINITKKMK